MVHTGRKSSGTITRMFHHLVVDFESEYGSSSVTDHLVWLVLVWFSTTPQNSMLVPLPAMKGQRAVIRQCTPTKGGETRQFLAQPTTIQVVVNVEENVFHVRDKETVRTKEIILFEYVS
jgi:hypothetical protein